MERYPIAGGGEVVHFDTGPFNWYVIQQGGHLTVVDAGFPGHYGIFKRGIGELGYSIKSVAAILLTHAHSDHTGFAERLRHESGAPVYIHAEDRAMAAASRQLPWFGLLSNAWQPYMARMLTHATINGVFTARGISKTVDIADGEILDVPGRPHVLHVPGHTAGEVAFFLPQSRVLLSGDTLVTRHLLNGSEGSPQVISPILTDDYKLARRSLDRMRELGRVTMLPGHGKAWAGDLDEAIDAAQEAARKIAGDRALPGQASAAREHGAAG